MKCKFCKREVSKKSLENIYLQIIFEGKGICPNCLNEKIEQIKMENKNAKTR